MFKQTDWDKVQATQQLQTSPSSQVCTRAAPAQPQHLFPSHRPETWCEMGRQGGGEEREQWH